jgi:hypothetical protein
MELGLAGRSNHVTKTSVSEVKGVDGKARRGVAHDR